jgi:hypothetical protein
MELECQEADGMKQDLHSGKVQEPALDTPAINRYLSLCSVISFLYISIIITEKCMVFFDK